MTLKTDHNTKRIVLILFALVLSLIACNGRSPSPGTTNITFEPSPIQVLVASDDITSGQPRIPLILQEGTEPVTDAVQVQVTLFDLSTEEPTAVWQGNATNYQDYDIPYWVVYPEVSQAGFWGMALDITLSDSTVTQAQIALEVVETSQSPAIGSVPPASQNRTLETDPDIQKLSTSLQPNPALYQMTVAEAINSKRPSVITFATPAFCQTRYCAPVVESVSRVHDTLADEVNFIHIEIYKETNPLVLADEVDEWGLTSEPWTFVLDNQGVVVARFGGPLSPQELTATLDNLLP